MKVEIDGVLYVPATEAVTDIDDILQALYEGYMGSGRSWREDPYTSSLYIGGVNEDGEGETFPEFLARLNCIRGTVSTGENNGTGRPD